MTPFKPIYRRTLADDAEVECQIAEGFRRGIIEPRSSPFEAPVLFDRKNDGSLHMCVNYRPFNQMMVKNKFLLSRIDDLLDQLHVASVFSSLDLQSAIKSGLRMMMCLRLHAGSLWVITSSECSVAGWFNAPATFQAAMNTIFKEPVGQFGLVLLDDLSMWYSVRALRIMPGI